MTNATVEKPRTTLSIAQRFQLDKTVGFKQLDQLAGRLGFKRHDGNGISYGNFIELLQEYVELVAGEAWPQPRMNRSVRASIGKLEQATAEQRKAALKTLLSTMTPEERAELLG